jgi:hypothetical protein
MSRPYTKKNKYKRNKFEKQYTKQADNYWAEVVCNRTKSSFVSTKVNQWDFKKCDQFLQSFNLSPQSLSQSIKRKMLLQSFITRTKTQSWFKKCMRQRKPRASAFSLIKLHQQFNCSLNKYVCWHVHNLFECMISHKNWNELTKNLFCDSLSCYFIQQLPSNNKRTIKAPSQKWNKTNKN